MATAKKSLYIPSLDGMRTASVAIVMAGHMFPGSPIPGGFGVTVFFVLSGFLITTLLMREWDKTGHIDFTGFYLRRVIRLLPPLLATMAVAVALVSAGLATGSLVAGGLVSMVLFYYNYWLIAATSQPIDAMGIVWSLAVEEHFYIFFPALFLLMLRKGRAAGTLAILAVAVLGWRTVKFTALGVNEWRIYSLTDTRIDSILWGCALAVAVHNGLIRRDAISDKAKWTALGLSVIALLASFAIRDDLFRSTIRYTIQSVAMLPVLYFAVNDAEQWPFRPLNWGWMRTIGVWSYTIYLCHKLFIEAVGTALPGLSAAWHYPIAIAITLIFAAAMNMFVERPLAVLRARLRHDAHGNSQQIAPEAAQAAAGQGKGAG